MKTYVVTITARGGLWKGKRTRYAASVEAESKAEAHEIALDTMEKELKRLREDYDALHVTKCVLKKNSTASVTV